MTVHTDPFPGVAPRLVPPWFAAFAADDFSAGTLAHLAAVWTNPTVRAVRFGSFFGRPTAYLYATAPRHEMSSEVPLGYTLPEGVRE